MEELKTTLSTKGWKIIETKLREEIVNLKLAKNVDIDKPYKDIAIETIANVKASKAVEKILNDIIRSANNKLTTKNDYV